VTDLRRVEPDTVGHNPDTAGQPNTDMEFNLTTTAAIFVVVIAVGVGGLIGSPVPMGTDTILMMVAPSMTVFGLICLGLGVKFGEHRASTA